MFFRENIQANPTETPCTTQSKSVQTSAQLLYTQEIYSWSVWTNLTGNFFARYTNGNGRNTGVRVYHLNIRKLQNKVSEIKNVMKNLNPHMFSVSECELKQTPNFDIEKIKVPGYNIFFPKSWNIHGYARVILYVWKIDIGGHYVPNL